MNKLLIALLAGGVIFGGVFALAAGLDVSSQSLQSGTDSVICDTDEAVDVSYNVSFSTEVDDYVVDSITVDGIDGACAGETVAVTIVTDSGATTYDATADGSGSVEITTTGLDPASFDDVYVLIGGTLVTS